MEETVLDELEEDLGLPGFRKEDTCRACSQHPGECPHFFRRVFWTCFKKWEECAGVQVHGLTPVRVESPTLASRPMEEYKADFELACRHCFQGPGDRRAIVALLTDGEANKHQITNDFAERVGRWIAGQTPYSIYPPSAYFNKPIDTSLRARYQL